MKKSIYIFSKKTNVDFLKDLPFLSEHFNIIFCQNLNAHETLSKNFDFISLSDGDYELFKPLIKAINWKTSHIGVADVLMKEGSHYKPLNLTADCIFQVLKNKKYALNTSLSVMIIGSYDFVLSVAVKAALSGYSDIIISLFEDSRRQELERKIKEFIFRLELSFIKLNDLTQLQSTSALLISNVSAQMDGDAFASIIYFNFLSHGAVFVDCQSHNDPALIEEAQRAELNVIEEIEILTLKYKTLIELSKISSLV